MNLFLLFWLEVTKLLRPEGTFKSSLWKTIALILDPGHNLNNTFGFQIKSKKEKEKKRVCH